MKEKFLIFSIFIVFLGCKGKEEKKDILEDFFDAVAPDIEAMYFDKFDAKEFKDPIVIDKKEDIHDIKDIPKKDIVDFKEVIKEDITVVEEVAKDIPLDEITKKAQVGEPCGEGIAECVEGASCVEDKEGSNEKKCYKDKEKGEACGAGIGVCVKPLTCGESGKEDPKFVCILLAKAGEECGGEFTKCNEGLICKGEEKKICYISIPEGGFCEGPYDLCNKGFVCAESGVNDGYKKKCLKEAMQGEPCGYGIAGCTKGTACNFDGPEHKNAICYPSLKEGDLCKGFALGPCPDGTSCVREKESGLTFKCLPYKKEGEGCGAGFGDCEEGFGCNFTSIPPEEKKCYKDLKKGDDCTQFVGIGLCEEGTGCFWSDEAKTKAQCFAEGKAGDECGKPGKGPCSKGSDCIWTDQTKTKAICISQSTPIGEECGVFGKGLCVSGSQCIWTTPAKISAKCYKDQPSGAECGAGFGLCEKGSGCVITDKVNIKGKCLPSQPSGFKCGMDIGGCEPPDYCVCTNPFSPDPFTCPDKICVPQDLTYFDTCIIGIEWVGLCPDDASCSLSSPNYPYKYKCYPLLPEGSDCGVGVGFCQEGLECVCDVVLKKKCTNEELISGTKGKCMKI